MKRKIFEPHVDFPSAALEMHFKQNPDDTYKKRGIELLAGCVLARAFERMDGYLPVIVVPLRKHTVKPPSIPEVIADKSLHVDGPIDLYLKNQDNTAHPVEITRLEEHFVGEDGSEGLVTLLRKKDNRSPDEDMILAVLVDVDATGELEKVRTYLEGKPYPFGFIFLIGQFGKDIRLGHFSCRMLHPFVKEPVYVQLSWDDGP